MKKLFLVLLLTSSLFASWNGIQGYKNVNTEWARWGSDSTETKLLFNDSKVYVDSSSTYVRIDNRADSCSKPINLTDGEFAYPIELQKISGSVESDVTVGNAVQFNIHTREYIHYVDANGKYQSRYTDWFQEEISTVGDTVKYLITIPTDSTMTTDKIWVKTRFNVSGDQMRLCPVANAISDSIWVDSLYYRGR